MLCVHEAAEAWRSGPPSAGDPLPHAVTGSAGLTVPIAYLHAGRMLIAGIQDFLHGAAEGFRYATAHRMPESLPGRCVRRPPLEHRHPGG